MPKLVLDGSAEVAGNDAVAPRLEAGSSDEQVDFGRFDHFEHLLGDRLDILGAVVVATHQGGDHVGIRAHGLLKQAAGTDGTVALFERSACMLLATEASEELVEVVSYSHVVPPLGGITPTLTFPFKGEGTCWTASSGEGLSRRMSGCARRPAG